MNIRIHSICHTKCVHLECSTMKISFLLPSLGGYGCERAAVNLIKGLSNRGLDVQLVLLGNADKFSSDCQLLAEIPTRVKIQKLTTLTKPLIWRKLWVIANYLKQEKPDILMTFYDLGNIAAFARFLAKVNTRIVMNIRVELSKEIAIGNPKIVSLAHFIYYLKGKIKSYIYPLTYSMADSVVALSNGVAKDVAAICRWPLAKIKVIYNPVYVEEILIKSQEQIYHPWFTTKDVPIILGVGRLEHQKDFPTLIHAFAIVRRLRKCRLVILGDGRMRQELEQLVKNLGLEHDVSLPGFRKNPYPYMKNADVFVLSSYYEGFGNVIAEALAVGTPVVSTNCPSGPAEILQHGKYGRLVPPHNPSNLAQAILTTLQEPSYPWLLQKRARDFDPDLIADHYLDAMDVSETSQNISRTSFPILLR